MQSSIFTTFSSFETIYEMQIHPKLPQINLGVVRPLQMVYKNNNPICNEIKIKIL